MPLPPGFVKHLEVKRLNPPYCWTCANLAEKTENRRVVCWKYGAYVTLYSTCDEFIKKEGCETTHVNDFEVAQKFRFGLDDLSK